MTASVRGESDSSVDVPPSNGLSIASTRPRRMTSVEREAKLKEDREAKRRRESVKWTGTPERTKKRKSMRSPTSIAI